MAVTQEASEKKQKNSSKDKGILVLPPVATSTYHFCKKCDTDRYHRVQAHSSPSSAKLECEVCKRKSTLKIAKKKPVRSTRLREKKESDAQNALWTRLKTEVNVESVSPYSMKGSFVLQAAINHPKFGIGFVTSVQDKKIEVIFEESSRLLIHNK